MSGKEDLLDWLREACGSYSFAPKAVYRSGLHPRWPLQASSEDELEEQLASRGHFMALPKEPAALANVVEVSVLDFLQGLDLGDGDITLRRGTERGYPDLEISGPRFGGGFHALDIKVARRAKGGRQTQSRITLYTGNTYFRYPKLKWPGTFRPFQDYVCHLDLIVLYTFEQSALSPVRGVELLIHEAWRIGSKQRSSTTREYLGAVTSIADLRAGKGEFESEEAFYLFWRKENFKIGRAAQKQLDKLLSGGDG